MTRARELSRLLNASSFSVDSDYNVGINSTSPDVKLDVGGAVLVTGISTFENTTQSTSPTTGALVISGGVGIAKSLNVGGNLSVAGTITYDDVTNIDSVGIVTAQSGVEFGVSGVGGTVTAVGNATFAGIVTAASFVGDGTGLTGVANTAYVVSVATTTGILNVGTGITANSSGINITGVATATSFSGTVPSSNLSGALPALDGSALTNLNIPTGFNELDAALFN